MNWTDLALVMGHLKGWIGWHFALKRKVSPKKFSAAQQMPITKLIPSPNPHLLPHLDGHATTPHYTSAWEAMNPSMDLLNMLVSKHWKTSQATHQPLCIVIHQSSFLNFMIQAMRSLLKHLHSIAVKWRIRETSLRWKCVQMGSSVCKSSLQDWKYT